MLANGPGETGAADARPGQAAAKKKPSAGSRGSARGSMGSGRAAGRPVRRTNLSAAIANRISAQIAQGRLVPGSRLQSERELSDLYGVGRSSIREAIKALESRGLVEGRQGEGRFVRAQDVAGLVNTPSGPVSLSTRDVEQLYEARKIVEPGMAALAAQRSSTRELAAMQRLLDRHQQQVEAGRYGSAEDTVFHMRLAAMADNPLLARLLEAVLQVLDAVRESAFLSARGLRYTLAGHREILYALESGDAATARQTMLDHLDRAQQVAVTMLSTPEDTAHC